MKRLITVLGVLMACACSMADSRAEGLRAGAFSIDVSPRKLPAIRNGGFTERLFNKVNDPLHARCLVLENGEVTIAIAIVDSCMIPRDLCDEAKGIVSAKTGIPRNRILIAATHTHSAPSVMNLCLGTRKDETYAKFLAPRIAEGIVKAHAKLARARAGWAVVDAPEYTNCRRWLYAPKAYRADPFGEVTVRAMMHPGYQNPDFIGPAGPVDTGLSVLSVETREGKPLGLLANYSMHYYGGGAGFSADYFGEFSKQMEKKIGGDGESGFVAMMSQGTSGDLHWMDYSKPKREKLSTAEYAGGLAGLAFTAYKGIEYRDEMTISMAERRIAIGRRLPDAERLKWAAGMNAERGEKRPKDRPQVYAEQAEWMAENSTEEIVLQALRIGEGSVSTFPNEVYGITGLKMKAQSPLKMHMNIELANGAAGYIPPPEQHYLGGYTTWPARTAGLEVGAEPKIVEGLLGLLEEVSGKERRKLETDFYNDQQREAIAKAKAEDNNRRNRGVR